MSHPHHGESHSDRLSRKAKDAPFMIVGLAGLVGLVGYGIYGFRTRKVKMSVYLIHMRVMAQGFVVTCLTAGVGYNLYLRHVQPKLYPPSIEDKKD
ncbi:HIG1 domain family member 1A, mitochondrial [Chionoecetes opilio]|uniref:HIG1 domain family member 1A, mitochondrial n=1 Tax=Chionoecetes opilio TaxID=41210 RepID=A0A8J4YQH4_CHIOP|nr:HIG1 domain family member 1A, mitochondrial [Chionoecetes opilio]